MSENLAPQVFQESGSGGFEIAFTALLCTYIIQLPTIEPTTDAFLVAGVLVLITIALLRMMAMESNYRPASNVINSTQVIIEIISFVTILYGLKIAIDSARIPVVMIYIAVILFPIFLIIMHEWLFGDLLIYYAAVAHDFHSGITKWEVDTEPWIHLKSEAIRFLESIMEQMLVLSRADIPLRLSKLMPYNSKISEHDQGGEIQQFAVVSGILSGVLTLPFIVVYFTAGTTIIQTLIAIWVVMYLRTLIRFWYQAYGLSKNANESMGITIFQITISVLFVVFLFEWGSPVV